MRSNRPRTGGGREGFRLTSADRTGELVASLDGRSVTYAATIHKSQGLEYPAEVIPVLTQHYAMLQRNLLYTGVTRGKRLVVLVGQKKAIAIAVRNVSRRRRWSKLDEWLRLGGVPHVIRCAEGLAAAGPKQGSVG